MNNNIKITITYEHSSYVIVIVMCEISTLYKKKIQAQHMQNLTDIVF